MSHGRLVAGEVVGLGVGVGLGDDVGVGVGVPEVGLGDVTAPVQVVPFNAKLAGTGLLPAHAPLKPKLAVPPVLMVPFQAALVTVTAAPDWVNDPFHSWVMVCPA